MNSTSSHKLLRSAAATLLAAAALLTTACSTTSTASKGDDKVVTYAVLHHDMLRLAEEPAHSDATSPIVARADLTPDMGGAPLASNP